MADSKDKQYSDDEAMRRMNEALKRALSMPHKPHAPLKPKQIGQRKKPPAKKRG